ncbi:MAG: HlyD family efflux transporter periplasmic adaptor subunit [Candidatus Aminicenantes bacterium]|nr:HlyD family efflux transporter periplasmic adaptor subunit [Candidatus Aminicenantes bacterium]
MAYQGSRLAALSVAILACLATTFLSCRKEKIENVITASGTIEAVEISVASKFSGLVEEVLVREGDRIRQGDRLAVMDSSGLEIQLRQAEAGVKLTEAQLALLLEGAREEDIRQAEAALKQARASLRLAEEDWKRWSSLAEKESATAKQRDDAETRYTVARAQAEAAEQALQKLRQLARPEEIQAARARLEQAIAARDLIKKSIADAVLIAPVPGVVTHRIAESGEFVIAGAPILAIVDLDKVELMLYLSTADLGKIRLGQTTEVTTDSYPGRIFEGRVSFISPEAEFTPRNIQTKEERVKLVYRVKVEIPNPEHILKPGLPADATLRIAPAASD